MSFDLNAIRGSGIRGALNSVAEARAASEAIKGIGDPIATEQKTTIFNGPWRGEPRDRDSSVGGRAAAREHSTADREAMIDDPHLQLARDSHGGDRPRDCIRHRPTGRYFGGGSADDHRGALVRGDGLGLPRETFGAPLASPEFRRRLVLHPGVDTRDRLVGAGRRVCDPGPRLTRPTNSGLDPPGRSDGGGGEPTMKSTG